MMVIRSQPSSLERHRNDEDERNLDPSRRRSRKNHNNSITMLKKFFNRRGAESVNRNNNSVLGVEEEEEDEEEEDEVESHSIVYNGIKNLFRARSRSSSSTSSSRSRNPIMKSLSRRSTAHSSTSAMSQSSSSISRSSFVAFHLNEFKSPEESAKEFANSINQLESSIVVQTQVLKRGIFKSPKVIVRKANSLPITSHPSPILGIRKLSSADAVGRLSWEALDDLVRIVEEDADLSDSDKEEEEEEEGQHDTDEDN